jgi:hypothetical protein
MEYGNVPAASQVMSKKFKKLNLKIVLALGSAQRRPASES